VSKGSVPDFYIWVHVVRVKDSVLAEREAQRKRWGGADFPVEPFKPEDMERHPIDLYTKTIYSVMPPYEGKTPAGVGCLVCVPMGEYWIAETVAQVREAITLANANR
jgi:hypothetical protein